MGWRAIVAFAAAVATAAACSGGASPPAPSVGTPEGAGGSSSGPIGTQVLGDICPDPADAAACPALGGQPAWVGCTRITESTNTFALQSCTCFATETGGGAWACEATDASPGTEEASASTPHCEACKSAADAAPSDGGVLDPLIEVMDVPADLPEQQREELREDLRRAIAAAAADSGARNEVRSGDASFCNCTPGDPLCSCR